MRFYVFHFDSRGFDVFHYDFPRVYLFALAVYSRACQPHYDLRGDLLGALSMWQRGLLKLIDLGYFEEFRVFLRGLEVKIHRDCLILWGSDVFFFWIHRNLIFLLNPDVSVMYGFWNIHRRCPI